MEYLLKALATIVDLAFRIYIFFLMLRFLLSWASPYFYHPFTRFLELVTEPPLRPLRTFIPSPGGFELPTLILMFVLQVIKLILIHALLGPPLGILSILLLAFVELLELALYIYLFSIFIQAILSWFPEMRNNPLNTFLYRLNDPLLRPARQYIRPVEGFDFSPLVVMLILYLLIVLLVGPLVALAVGGAQPVQPM